MKTEGGLNASASFVAKANPLNRAPHKRKSELHHALCNMLSNILAPLADGGKGQWPPSGVEPALTVWYEAVARIRVQLMHWMDKQSKHISVRRPPINLNIPIFFILHSDRDPNYWSPSSICVAMHHIGCTSWKVATVQHM